MFLYACNALPCKTVQGAKVTCCFEQENVRYGLADCDTRLFDLNCMDGHRIELSRPYSKIAPGATENTYIACCKNSFANSCVYFLDESFREVDSTRLGLCKTDVPILDIWFDRRQGILFAVTATQIHRFNLNGDYLGEFMCAPKGRKYKSLCTFKQFIFIAYEDSESMYVASYTENGSFLEKVSIGSEYSACNMQVIAWGEAQILHVFCYKNIHFPCMLTLMLEGNSPPCNYLGDISVEAFGEEAMRVTCAIDSDLTIAP